MKWLLSLGLLLAPLAAGQIVPLGNFFSGGAGAWSRVQNKYYDNHGNGTGGSSCATSGTTCVVTVTAVNRHDVLVIYSEVEGTTASISLSSVTEETASLDCSACQNFDTVNDISLDVRYVTDATGTETTITCNFSAASSGYQGCGVVEWKPPPGTTVSLDTGNKGGQPTTCGTSCTAVALTLGGTNDAILQTIFPADNASAITTYNIYCHGSSGAGSCSGIGSADLINTSSGTAPTWTVGSASEGVWMNAIALKAVGGVSGSWSVIQSQYNDDHGSNCATTGTSCQITLSQAVGAHHILVIYEEVLSASSITLSSISEETATDCSACQVTAVASPQQDIMYVLNATGTETTITCNFNLNSGSYQGCGVIELSYTGSTPTFANGNATSSGACSGTSCSGATYTASTNALVVQTAFPGNSMNSVASPYTAFCSGSASPCDGIGAAYLLGTSSNTNATWTAATSGDSYSANVIVIKGN